MTLVQMKTGSKKGYQGKVPLIYFLRKSGKQHNKLRVDLQNNFITGDNIYPKNRQVNIVPLEKYTKYSLIQQTTSEGTTFSQTGGSSNKQLPPYYEKYWGNIQCFRCLHKGHPASHCTKQLPILIVINKVMKTNISQVNKIGMPRLARQKV